VRIFKSSSFLRSAYSSVDTVVIFRSRRLVQKTRARKPMYSATMVTPRRAIAFQASWQERGGLDGLKRFGPIIGTT
jgi:hypothetical protein